MTKRSPPSKPTLRYTLMIVRDRHQKNDVRIRETEAAITTSFEPPLSCANGQAARDNALDQRGKDKLGDCANFRA